MKANQSELWHEFFTTTKQETTSIYFSTILCTCISGLVVIVALIYFCFVGEAFIYEVFVTHARHPLLGKLVIYMLIILYSVPFVYMTAMVLYWLFTHTILSGGRKSPLCGF